MKSHYTVKKPILIEDHDSTDDSDIGIDEDTTAEAEVIDSEFWHIHYIILHFIESQMI